jgi:hypothetical protein
MDLIDRYLQAVKFWLPKQQKQDIIAELSEDIHAQVEEQESGLGRPLTDAEVVALLKQRGRPVLVANRYLPQEYLIGPVLFPIYLFVLRVVALCYLVPWVLVWIGMMTYSPAYRAAQGAHSWISAVGTLWGSFWLTASVTVGAVTIAFAVLEQAQARSHFLEKWDPRKLPPVRDPKQIPRSASIIELVVNLFFFGWWAQNMTAPIVFQHPDVRIMLAPVWIYFYWSILALTLVNASLAAVNLLRPYATRTRAAVRLVSDCAGSVLFCWLLKANVLTGIAIAGVSSQKALEITNAMNWWMAKLFPAALLVCVVIAAVNVYKIVRVKPVGVRPAHQATIVAAVLLVVLGAALRMLPLEGAHTTASAPPASIEASVE